MFVSEAAAEQMAANPTKASGQPAKMKKDESLLGKLGGTLVRKKKLKEGNVFRNIIPVNKGENNIIR